MPRNTITAFLFFGYMFLNPQLTFAQEKFEHWYQIDTIFFKPLSVDLNDEAWPTVERSYPPNITTSIEGQIFKLSQLEQANASFPNRENELAQKLEIEEFAFAKFSNRARNQKVIEQNLAGFGDTSKYHSKNLDTKISPVETVSRNANTSRTSPATPEEIIKRSLANREVNSPGVLAFSDQQINSTLQNLSRSLQRSSLYNVLGHQSWLQPINSDPTPVLIQTGKRFNDQFELSGTLSFTRSRFLHLQTDLWFTIFESDNDQFSNSSDKLVSSLPQELISKHPSLIDVERKRGLFFPAKTHLMSQSRRMRSDELHYIDHPLFGMIIRIKRFEMPQE